MRTLLAGHTHLVVSAVGLGCARDRDRVIRLMDIAKNEMHIPVIFSTNIRPAVWKFGGNAEASQWQAQAREWIAKALPHVSTILASHSDEKLIFGDEDAEKTLLRLKSLGIPEIVVTDGAETHPSLPIPRMLRNRTENVELPTARLRRGQMISGAGDAFAGGYIGSRIEEQAQSSPARAGAELDAGKCCNGRVRFRLRVQKSHIHVA